MDVGDCHRNDSPGTGTPTGRLVAAAVLAASIVVAVWLLRYESVVRLDEPGDAVLEFPKSYRVEPWWADPAAVGVLLVGVVTAAAAHARLVPRR